MTRSNGFLVPDSNKRSNGIKAVVDQIHALGLKFGELPFPLSKWGIRNGNEGVKIDDSK